MNIWGLQQQTKGIIISKKKYLLRPRNKISPILIKNFDREILNRKEMIRELRVAKRKKK